MATDKRRHPRFLVRLKVRYQAGEDRWRPAFTKEVSTTGLYVLTAHVPTSSKVQLEVTTDEGIVSLQGRVLRGDKVPPRLRRLKSSGIAIALSDPPDLWCRVCLDLEEKNRERGAIGNSRFVQVTTEVSDPSDHGS